MQTKYLLKLKLLGYNFKNNIFFFTKEYFPSNYFVVTTTWRTTMMFSWFQKLIKGLKWLIPEQTHWMVKNTCSSSFTVYQTCRDIWWNFFFCCEASFPIGSRLWIFSLRFSFLDFSDFWISPPVLEKKTPLFISEDREFEFQIPEF